MIYASINTNQIIHQLFLFYEEKKLHNDSYHLNVDYKIKIMIYN